MNKKGYAIELIAFVVIGIISVAFFGMMIYGFNLINNTLSSGALDSSVANVSKASNASFGYVNSGMDGLKLISAIIIIGYALATLAFAYFSSRHPAWIFVYILITIIIVIFSIYISNSYEDLMANSILGPTFTSFGISSFIILHLPTWTAVIGLFGIVLSITGNNLRRSLE